MPLVVYYIGDKYYLPSGTIMSSLYTEEGSRYDWGFLRRDIELGHEVTIKSATPEMIAWADDKLAELKRQ